MRRVTRQNPRVTIRDFADLIDYNDNGDGTATVTLGGEVVGTFDGPDTPIWSGLVGRPSHLATGVEGDGATDDQAALSSSDDAALAAKLPLMLPVGTYKVSSNLTIDSPVWFTPGSVIKPDDGITVTLAGGIVNAPMSQIFDASAGGTVVPQNVDAVHPQWWGAVAGETDNSDAFQAAIDASVGSGGIPVVVGQGDWRADGLTVPIQSPVKIVGHAATVFAGSSTVSGGSRLIRINDRPVLSCAGATGVPEVWTTKARDLQLHDISIEDGTTEESTTEPLMEFNGGTGFRFTRCVFHVPVANSVAPILTCRGLWDTDFTDCTFLGGGDDDNDIGALRFFGGDDTNYNASKEIRFTNAHIENYAGPGLEIGSDDSTTYWCDALQFSNLKMESRVRTGPHIVIQRAQNLQFGNAYISHWLTDSDVIDVVRVNGLYGDFGFNQIYSEGYEQPASRLKLSANATYVDLDLRVHVGPDANQNVVTQANTSDEKVSIRINGNTQLTNSTNPAAKFLRHGLVYQKVTSDTTNCAYVLNKAGRNQWLIGSPGTYGNDTEFMKISALDPVSGQQADFLVFRSSGQNPSTAIRQLVINGQLRVNNTAAFITSGTGTPEGSVTAPVGSLYMRTDGGAGTTLYAKETGAGNTGWQAMVSAAE